jgi:prepilin-type N-terminal cleavage/methylation domain-containing protein
MVHRDQGFTVVELLVAMSVIAGVMVFLASAISFTRQYLVRSAEAIAAADEIALLNRLLGSELNHALLDPQSPSIVGTNRELTVRTNATRALPWSRIVLLTVRTEDDSKGAVVTWRTNARSDEVVSHRLTRPGRPLRFSYFTDKTGWISSWTNQSQNPKLIRASISDHGQDSIDLIFPVRSVRPTQCATEPAALRFCGELQ